MSNTGRLKSLLWMGAAYHVALGVVGVFGKAWVAAVARNAFGFNLTVMEEVLYVIDPLAALMAAMGVVFALRLKKEVSH